MYIAIVIFYEQLVKEQEYKHIFFKHALFPYHNKMFTHSFNNWQIKLINNKVLNVDDIIVKQINVIIYMNIAGKNKE